MGIDFTLPPDIEEVRQRVRTFIEGEVRPVEDGLLRENAPRSEWVRSVQELRQRAREVGLWNPHLPPEWGGMGLGPTAMAFVHAEAGRTMIGPYILNAQAPDEGNMHTLLHWGTPEQKEKYLRPLAEGRCRSCFAMTEPEVAGSDPTLLQTRAVQDGDYWVINGHKWFASGARGAKFAIVIACTDPDADPPQARNSAFIVDIPTEGWELVRTIATMAGEGNHGEIRLNNVRVPASNMLGPRGQGHLLGQYRLGPARLAHCMRWIGQAEVALEMLVDRALNRFAHGSYLADKQAIQWMIAESAMELYTAKLMVLHAAYKIERGLPFRQEVAMAKVHVANTLWRVVDRAIQVHGALGYSTDTPLERWLRHARAARIVDGADEVHMQYIARHVIETFKEKGKVKSALGDLM
ncbi:Acryloyl-CoA reductase (NADH) [bacterium HR25]|nr:Acryloyl-CoA reductase (NADH) [bacterium HR25]